MKNVIKLLSVLLISGCTCTPTKTTTLNTDETSVADTEVVVDEMVEEFEAGVPVLPTVVVGDLTNVLEPNGPQSLLPEGWVKVSGHNWSLHVPKHDVIQSSNEFEFAAVLKVDGLELLFSVDSESSDGDTLQDVKKVLLSSYGTLVKVHTEQTISLNGYNILFMDTDIMDHKASALIWAVVHNNTTHVLSCGNGGMMTEQSSKICTTILNTLELR